MNRDPLRICGPAVICFSGGRTSAYMLWRIVQARGGRLPPDVVVVFANTGREMPETLDFVRDCSEKWDVEIVWLEYRDRAAQQIYAVVDYASASRDGAPYSAAIEHRSYLPNPVTRFCTSALKIEPIQAYARSLGWEEWDEVVGLRKDEPQRIARLSENRIAPLARAGITKADVRNFWKTQNWGLLLPLTAEGASPLGNCCLCFLKGAGTISAIMRERPERASWWIEQEKKIGGTFRSDRPSYAELADFVSRQGNLDLGDIDQRIDCYCSEDQA